MGAEEKKEKGEGIYRMFESSGINLISAYQKVLQILKEEIPAPEVVEIFPTNYCNFDCPHCRFENYHGDTSQYMETSALEKLLEELSQRKVFAIELSGGGEALEHPHVEEFFQKLVEGNFRLGIITNGYKLITSDKLKEYVLRAGNWIRFSVDGFSDETYQLVHGKKDIKYAELRKPIQELVKAKRDILSVEMKMLVSKLNAHECGLAVEEALKLGVNCLQFKFLGNHENELGDAEMYAIRNQIRSFIEMNALELNFFRHIRERELMKNAS